MLTGLSSWICCMLRFWILVMYLFMSASSSAVVSLASFISCTALFRSSFKMLSCTHACSMNSVPIAVLMSCVIAFSESTVTIAVCDFAASTKRVISAPFPSWMSVSNVSGMITAPRNSPLSTIFSAIISHLSLYRNSVMSNIGSSSNSAMSMLPGLHTPKVIPVIASEDPVLPKMNAKIVMINTGVRMINANVFPSLKKSLKSFFNMFASFIVLRC